MSRDFQTPLFSNRLPLEVTISDTDKTLEFFTNREWIDENTIVSLEAADIVFIPWVNFRDIDKPVFPNHTAELFRFIQEHAPAEVHSEVAVSDEEYSEVLLHADQIWLPDLWIKAGTVVVSSVLIPLTVNLLTEWIKHHWLERSKKADVTFELFINEPNGSVKKIRYVGPAEELGRIVELVKAPANNISTTTRPSLPSMAALPTKEE